eukprot:2202170-Rhodomonas_salina.1
MCIRDSSKTEAWVRGLGLEGGGGEAKGASLEELVPAGARALLSAAQLDAIHAGTLALSAPRPITLFSACFP